MKPPEIEATPADSPTRNRLFQPYLPLMALTTIIWGAAFPITKPALADMPPATFALLRFVVSIIVMLPLVFIRRGGFHIPRREWWRVGLAGITGFTVIQLGQNWGLNLSLASDIAILTATEPITITLLAAYFLGEKPARTVWLGLIFSLTGVLFVIGINPLSLFGGGKAGEWQRVAGDLIFLAGTLGFSAYNVMSRSFARRGFNGLEVTTAAVICGIIGLAPFSLFEVAISGRAMVWSGPVIFGLLYAGLLVTVFGFLVLNWALKRVQTAKVALLFYLQPVSGVLVAWLGGEPLTWNFFIGATLILIGVYIAQRG